MKQRNLISILGILGPVSAAISLASACASGEPAEDGSAGQGGEGSDGQASNGQGGASAESSLYVMATAVSDDNGANTYVATFDRFAAKLDLGSAREFPGWSDMMVIGGEVFVSSGEAPTITRLEVDASGKLGGDETISFLDYATDANFYNHAIISDTKAYLSGEGEYVIWNPSTLEISGTFPLPDLPDREGIVPYTVLDRGAVVRDDRLFHAVAWSDTENLRFLPDSRIVVIDTDTDEVIDVITVPCPDLAVADRDEAGNLYFSNWVYSPGGTLLYDQPPACAVRIPAGSETFDDWRLSYTEDTGREGAVLNYMGGGQWVFSSFMGEADAWDPETDWFSWLFGNHWQTTAIDPDSRKATPIPGLPYNGGGYYLTRFDDVTRFLLPSEDYTATTVYALDQYGAAHKETEANGWATRLFKLR